jgi:hypothetical protein
MAPHQAAFIIIKNVVNVKATIFLTHKAVFHILQALRIALLK